MADPVTDEQMSPDASPGEVSKRSGVRRVNNLPVYIVGGAMAVFLLVMALVATDRAAKQNRPADAQKEKGGNSSMFANQIAGRQKDGIIPPEAPKPLKMPDLPAPLAPGMAPPGTIAIARPDNLDLPPPPPLSPSREQQLQRPAQDPDLDRIRMAKMQRFEEAVRAKTGVPVTAARSAASPAGAGGTPTSREEVLARLTAARQQAEAAVRDARDDPTAAYRTRLAQLQPAAGGGIGGAPSPGAPGALLAQSAGGRNSVGQFGSSGQADRWKLNSETEAPRTSYELRAGFVVPATLISGINSELPGQIVAQVAQHVYDTPTGKHLLIPQGSRLVGSYSSDVAYGQSRVLVAWQRIVFPDGKALDTGAMPGADAAGYAGFNDQVNNHYFRLFGSAFLMSAVVAGIAYSQNQNQTINTAGTVTASSAMSEAVGQQLGQATAQLISKNLSIAPTLEIRPGYRFNVIVTKDMAFSKPYKSFDY